MKDATRAVLAGGPIPPGAVRPGPDDGDDLAGAPLDAADARRLAETVAALEGGYRAELAGSGPAALAATLFSLLSPGDQLLVDAGADAAVHRLCNGLLARFGVRTTVINPSRGVALADLMGPDTAALLLAAPGDVACDLPDVPALAAAADAAGVWTILDNSWATPLGFKPFEYGVDVAIQDASRHLAGRGDLRLGVATATRTAYPKLARGWRSLGEGVGAETAQRVLTGMESLPARMARHAEGAVMVAAWLAARPEVDEVRYPPLPGDSSHEIWRRDFQGAGARLVATLDPRMADAAGVAPLLSGLQVFGHGAPWGGARSLIAVNAGAAGDAPRVSLHIGLEDAEDLIADLARGFERLDAAR